MKQKNPKKVDMNIKKVNVKERTTDTETKKKAVSDNEAGRKKEIREKAKVAVKNEKKAEPALETSAPELKDTKMEAFYYNISSLQKSAMDPKGTMLVAKYKQHEIGIHVDPKLSSLLFSYYPREGKGEMINIPVSIKDIINFISQKAS